MLSNTCWLHTFHKYLKRQRPLVKLNVMLYVKSCDSISSPASVSKKKGEWLSGRVQVTQPVEDVMCWRSPRQTSSISALKSERHTWSARSEPKKFTAHWLRTRYECRVYFFQPWRAHPGRIDERLPLLRIRLNSSLAVLLYPIQSAADHSAEPVAGAV